MIRFLRHLFNPDAKTRRWMSGLCGIFLLGSLLLSSIFVIAEADHDCSGEECPVCVQIQCCLDGLQQTGEPLSQNVVIACGEPLSFEPVAATDYRAPATTLQSLYVRMDE